MKRVLMVAYHFPPLAGSSGVQRTLRFVQQLPQHGWEPLVLTVQSLADRQSIGLLQADPPRHWIEQEWSSGQNPQVAPSAWVQVMSQMSESLQTP